LDKAEEAKKRHEKMKFAEECEVSITILNRIRYRYEEAGFLGLIDKRNGNPDRNKEIVNRVKKKYLETGLNGKKLRNVLIEDGLPLENACTDRHVYRLLATYNLELLIGTYSVPGERTVRKLVNAVRMADVVTGAGIRPNRPADRV